MDGRFSRQRRIQDNGSIMIKVMAFIIAPLITDAPRLVGCHDRQTGALSPSPAATCRFCPTIAFGDAFGSPATVPATPVVAVPEFQPIRRPTRRLVANEAADKAAKQAPSSPPSPPPSPTTVPTTVPTTAPIRQRGMVNNFVGAL